MDFIIKSLGLSKVAEDALIAALNKVVMYLTSLEPREIAARGAHAISALSGKCHWMREVEKGASRTQIEKIQHAYIIVQALDSDENQTLTKTLESDEKLASLISQIVNVNNVEVEEESIQQMATETLKRVGQEVFKATSEIASIFFDFSTTEASSETEDGHSNVKSNLRSVQQRASLKPLSLTEPEKEVLLAPLQQELEKAKTPDERKEIIRQHTKNYIKVCILKNIIDSM